MLRVPRLGLWGALALPRLRGSAAPGRLLGRLAGPLLRDRAALRLRAASPRRQRQSGARRCSGKGRERRNEKAASTPMN